MAAKILIIRALEACNAGCFMCNFAFSNHPYRIDLQKLNSILGDIAGSEIRVIRFTGGEPLLIEDFETLIKATRNEGLLTSVITNGWHLSNRAKGLLSAGLDQVIISLDGPSPAYHDKFRRLPGLFERIVLGIEALRQTAPSICIRVNSVVGAHNVHLLSEMWDLLEQINVNQWSLIPLKRSDGAWGSIRLSEIELHMESLRTKVTQSQSSGSQLRLLGYGIDLFGRTEDERRILWHSGRNLAPRKQCLLVDQVRYFTPNDGFVYPCNCIPHRSKESELFEEWNPASVYDSSLIPSRDWLRMNGPLYCTGCEPVNAALGEGATDLDDDPFGF